MASAQSEDRCLRQRQRAFKRRAALLGGLFMFGLLLVVARVAYLQVVRYDHFTRLAKDQYRNDVRVPPRRGHIYDRHGKPVALSVDVPSLYANPSRIKDPREVARVLAKKLDINLHTLYRRLASDRLFVWVKRHVTPEVAQAIMGLNLPGVAITREPRRFYPNRDVAAHLVGFTDVDGRGLEGLERALDSALAGEPQVVAAVRDARGRAVLEGGLDPEQRARGEDVVLTLDLRIQHRVQQALEAAVQEHRAQSAMVVVLDVVRAEILALAVAPGFNANTAGQTPAGQRRNRAVTDVFEPGSTLKPLVVAAALQAGVINQETAIDCGDGALRIGGYVVRDSRPYGVLGLGDILAKSVNAGTVRIAQTLGAESLEQALRAYGFGKRIGLHFPGESAGLLRSSESWSQIGLANLSFGHGLAVTAVQLAGAYRVLAADGMYRAPTLLRRFERSQGGVRYPTARPERRVLRADVAKGVLGMLGGAVAPGGTGHRAAVPGYAVAGKTGTAQKVDLVAGGYSSDRFVAAFAGAAPLESPRAVAVVMVDEPQGVHTGGAVAAPIFSKVMGITLELLGVPPSDPTPWQHPPPGKAPPAMATLHEQVAMPRTVVSAGAKKPAGLDAWKGMTSREVLQQYMALEGVGPLELHGSGVVVEASVLPSPEPGWPSPLRLRLARD